jgi:hypothetical protein
MMKLLPQIRHWIKTKHVAAGKIINRSARRPACLLSRSRGYWHP